MNTTRDVCYLEGWPHHYIGKATPETRGCFLFLLKIKAKSKKVQSNCIKGGIDVQKRLIRRAQKGDMQAYEDLFGMYEVELYKLAFVYVKNREDALDLVQEVAYRSCKYIKSLKKPAYYKTWLIRILMNCASDYSKKHPVHAEMEPELYIAEQDESLDIKVTLEGVMQYLTKEEKDVVLLKYYEDYTFEQIAEVLELKLGTTKTILYRALKKLRLALVEEGTTYEQFKG